MAKQTPRAITLLVFVLLLGAPGVAAATSWVVGLTNGSVPAQSQSNGINPPTGGSATFSTSSSLLISWSAPSTGALPSGYTITRNGSPVPSGSGCFGTITTTSCTDTGLPVATTFTYTVTAVAGSNWVSTASSQFSYTYTISGVMFTNIVLSGGSQTCTSQTISANITCTASPLGGTGSFAANVKMVNSSGTPFTNTSGSAIAVTCSEHTVSSPGATVSPTSSTIANNSVTSGSTFTMTGLGPPWKATMTCSVTLNSTTYNIAVTGN